MAFNVGYVRLCDRNIHHIYTTTDIKPAATRKSPEYKPEFLEEQDRKRRDRLNNRRFMQYYPRHDIELPRAPAFRTFNSETVSGIVNRLSLPADKRFNFRHPMNHVAHNDWRTAYKEKLNSLKDTMNKFGRNRLKKNKRKKHGQYHDYVERLAPADE